MNPATGAAIVLGLLAAWAVSRALGGSAGGNFVTEGGAKFWKKELAPQLVKALSVLKATPHSSVERVWVLGPTGPQDALALARSIQQKGNLASTSPTLLEAGGGPKALGEVTQVEFMTFTGEAAILPVL